MSRNDPRKTGRSKHDGAFYVFHHWIARTMAWQSLSAVERCVYLEMALLHNGTNNGRICFGARSPCEALKISKTTAGRALKVLEERGFIVCVRRGHFAMLESHRAATEWRLTEFACDGQPATKDFARWTLEKTELRPVSGTRPYLRRDNTVPVAGR